MSKAERPRRAIPLGDEPEEGLAPKSLLKKVAFTLNTELSFPGVFACHVNKADSWTDFKFAGVKTLAVGTVQSVGDAKNTG